METCRHALAAQQAALVRALVAGGAAPAGFDAGALARAARALVNKRLREVAMAWPALAEALAGRFPDRFRAYAGQHPPPAGGPAEDGERFARWLAPQERGDAAERLLLRRELARRTWAIRFARLPASGRRLVGLCAPGLGVRVWG